MNPKEGVKEPVSKSLSGSTIHIVGPHLFCNELLGNMIESETGARCLCVKSFENITETSRNGSQQELFLWDCLGKNHDEFVAEFESSAEKIAGSGFVALFNVRHGLGIEDSCVDQGVRGIFYEDDKISHFLKGISAVLKGELWFSRDVMTKFILDERDDEKASMRVGKILTQRETEILSLVAVGCKNEEIADKLCVSPHTIKTHLYNLYKKINVTNRLQATLWAAKKL
jgi:DNA-binding CsgD family transcriptional regulator